MVRSSIREIVRCESQLAAELRLRARPRPVDPAKAVGDVRPRRGCLWAATEFRYF